MGRRLAGYYLAVAGDGVLCIWGGAALAGVVVRGEAVGGEWKEMR